MALTGDCSHTTWNEVDGEEVENTTEYTNIYVCIKELDNINYSNGQFYKVDSEGNQTEVAVINYIYAGYTDEATKIADAEDFLFSESMNLKTYKEGVNLESQVYSEITELEGKENLTIQ
jgi:hypothetical protein|tara:strand:+ start:7341 stop:7697 length:357 start_codon:yes stop_codon:yes gene_type:complete